MRKETLLFIAPPLITNLWDKASLFEFVILAFPHATFHERRSIFEKLFHGDKNKHIIQHGK